MQSKIIASGLVALTCCAATACGSSQAAAPPASSPAAAPSTASPASTPTPGATNSSKAALTEDDLKNATVTAADLGKAWEASSGGSGPVPVTPGACPQPQRSTTKLEATGRVWQGFRSESAGLTVALTAQPDTDAGDFKAAYAADLKKCKKVSLKSGKDTFVVVDSAEGPSQVPGADEVLGSSVRRYYLDTPGQPLVQAIQTLVCRKGAVIVDIGYGPYGKTPAETGKRVKDFTAASKLMQQQLDKLGDTPPA